MPTVAVPRFRNPLDSLRKLPTPRPFAWYSFVKQRRTLYGFVALLILIVFIVLPILWSLGQMHNEDDSQRVRPNQVIIYFGMLVVVASVRYFYVVQKLWDDSKTLARYGRLGEANLLWVIASPQRSVVTYRFFTPDGQEIVRETVIDADGPHPLAELSAGDVVPMLYDFRHPRRRNMLWAEIERYVTLVERPRRGAAAAALPIAASVPAQS